MSIVKEIDKVTKTTTASKNISDAVKKLSSLESDEKLNNFVDGNAEGSVRSVFAKEDYYNSGTGKLYKIGKYAFAEGHSTEASGEKSHAEGHSTEASGEKSHAEGYNTKASGIASHAEGGGTGASADNAHAEGSVSIALGACSHAEGNNTKANGIASHAEGEKTKAYNYGGHSEGIETISEGRAAHSEGCSTNAIGEYSHAEGYESIAKGVHSHAQNKDTIASSDSQTSLGKYNIEDTNGLYAVIIGNGSGDYERSNALAIKWDGTFVFADGTEISPAEFASLKALLTTTT